MIHFFYKKQKIQIRNCIIKICFGITVLVGLLMYLLYGIGNKTLLLKKIGGDKNEALYIAESMIRDFEGLVLTHQNGITKNEVIIGYGDNICKETYKERVNITRMEAEKCLRQAVANIYNNLAPRLPGLSATQYAAIISLVFNVGYDNFYHSRVFRLLQNRLHNNPSLAIEWLDFNHADHHVVTGLTVRRAREYKLFSANPEVYISFNKIPNV